MTIANRLGFVGEANHLHLHLDLYFYQDLLRLSPPFFLLLPLLFICSAHLLGHGTFWTLQRVSHIPRNGAVHAVAKRRRKIIESSIVN